MLITALVAILIFFPPLFQSAEEAEKLYIRALEGRREKFGNDHPATKFSLFLMNRFEQKKTQISSPSMF